jgi:MFS family permease
MGLWRTRSFGLLWVAQALSQLGTSVSAIAYPLVILDLTGSAAEAGLTATVLAASTLVLRVPAGSLVDRWHHRRIMLVADAVRGVAVTSVALAAFAQTLSVPHILVVAVVEAAFGVFFGPAQFALLRVVMPPERRSDAIGLMQPASYAAALAGPVTGGAAYAFNASLPFAIDATSYFASFVCVCLVRTVPTARPTGNAARLRAEIMAGLRWLRGERFLWAASWWSAALTALFGAVGLTLIVLARSRGASAAQIGAMYTLSGAGGLAGALLTPALTRALTPARTLACAAGLDGLACLALHRTSSPYLMGVIGASAFVMAPAANTVVYGHLAATVPDRLTAGVNASLTQVVNLFAPFAPFMAGAATDRAGPGNTILLCGALFGALTAAVFAVPSLRTSAVRRG